MNAVSTQSWLIAVIMLLIAAVVLFFVLRNARSNRDDSIDSSQGVNAKTDWLPDDGHSAALDDGSTAAGNAAAASHGTPPAARPMEKTARAPATTPAPRPKTAPEPAASKFAVPSPSAQGGKPDIAPAAGDPDNLRQIKGVGPKLNTLLGELGITRFDQIAAWKSAEVEEVDRYLGNFQGRITRDDWVDQAGYLATSDIAGFEAKYGKL